MVPLQDIRSYKNNPQLYVLDKIVKDGFIEIESKISFKEDGSIDECGNSTIIPRHNVYEIKEVS